MSESIRRNAFCLSAARLGMSTILGARLQIRWNPTTACATVQRHSNRAGEYSQAIGRQLGRLASRSVTPCSRVLSPSLANDIHLPLLASLCGLQGHRSLGRRIITIPLICLCHNADGGCWYVSCLCSHEHAAGHRGQNPTPDQLSQHNRLRGTAVFV